MSSPATVSDPRSRWQVAAIVFAMVFPSIGTWLYFVAFAGHSAVGVVYAITKIVQFGFPLVWVLAMERKRLRMQRPDVRGMLVGVAFGITVLTAMLALYYGVLGDSSYTQQGRAPLIAKLNDFGANTPLGFLGLAVFYCLLHSFMEEYYWRWFVFGRLRQFTGLWTAIVVSSLGFMAHHVIVVSRYSDDYVAVGFLSLSVAVGGAVWAWIYERYGTLFATWISHMFVDAGIMLVGYHMAFGG